MPSTRAQKKAIPVDLDRARSFRFDLNALAAVEDATGVNLYRGLNEETTIKHFRAFVWAGLLHEDDTLTERQVGAMVDGENMEAVGAALKDALALAFPQPKDASAEAAAEAPSLNGTGVPAGNDLAAMVPTG